MSDCIFCKIANNEAPCFKIWENDEFMAFLDIMPNVKWQTLVIPKKHYDSDLFEIDDADFYKRLMSATKEVIDMLKKSLKVQRVWMIMEWMWVNHKGRDTEPLWVSAFQGLIPPASCTICPMILLPPGIWMSLTRIFWYLSMISHYSNVRSS